MQRMFIIFIDIYLLITIVVDVILLIRNRKRDMERLEENINYEMKKTILDTKKDLKIASMLSDLDDRITKIEKQLNKEEK